MYNMYTYSFERELMASSSWPRSQLIKNNSYVVVIFTTCNHFCLGVNYVLFVFGPNYLKKR